MPPRTPVPAARFSSPAPPAPEATPAPCRPQHRPRRRPRRRHLAPLLGALALLLAPSAWAEAPVPAVPAPGAVAVPGAAVPASIPAPGAVLQRVQVLHDPANGTVARRLVKVREAFPGEGLQFLWEPAEGPGLDAGGFASGPGRLLWRIPGAASYDPRALAARFEGTLRAGAPQGQGRLTLRDGSWRDGEWQAGLQQGEGRWSRPDGSLYEGGFVGGLPEGAGVLRAAAGWIYRGPFRAGLPEGEGRLRLPSGEERAVTMRAGEEIKPRPPEDRPLLMQGGEAARVQISVVTNARIALQQSLSYTHYNSGEALQIYPQDEVGNSQELLDLWSGTGTMGLPWLLGEMTPADWLATRAFLDITLETSDGGRVRVEELRLALDRSLPWLRPMLEPHSEYGCVGSRPWFELVNAGWGAVENPQLRVRFAMPPGWDAEAGVEIAAGPPTGWFDAQVPGFDAGTTVDLRPALEAAGVDLATLEGNRFTCPGPDDLASCAANLLQSVPLGALAGAVSVDDGGRLLSEVQGELSYQWRDGDGVLQQAVEGFSLPVTLAVIELPSIAAEMGAGGAFSTPAPEFQEIELPIEGQDLQLALPLRGNPDRARAEAHVQLFAQRSSIHLLRIEAQLGDGSVASSMPLQLFYLSPRDTSGWRSARRPLGCFLPTEF